MVGRRVEYACLRIARDLRRLRDEEIIVKAQASAIELVTVDPGWAGTRA
jgi:hypothetical protein